MRRLLAAALVAALLLAGCAVPHRKGDQSAAQVAIDRADATAVFTDWSSVRRSAADLLDPKPLSTVESGPLLAVDTGTFEVQQKLAAGTERDGTLRVDSLDAPRLDAYPLWFVLRVEDPARDVTRLQLYQRATPATPWLLVAAPEILADTELPELRRDEDAVVPVAPSSKASTRLSPQQAADRYAAALADQKGPEASQVESDGFVRQMRDTAATNALVQGVRFSQAWAAESVQHALRTADGGALVFATLKRDDRYRATRGDLDVSWPAGSPQQALLGDVSGSRATLRYYHQVLLYVPPEGDGRPRALGQFGGVASATSR